MPLRWRLSLSAAVFLTALLLGGDAVLLWMINTSPDPHGYVLIFGTMALIVLLLPTGCALVSLVGLLRRRPYGYAWLIAGYALVAAIALFLLVVSVL